MKLVKYSKSGSAPQTSNNNSGGSRSETTTISGGGSISREIWGQHDEGDDLDGSMLIHGDVRIKTIDEKTYEPDDDSDGDDVEEESGGGSLYVDENCEIGKNLHVGNHLYIKHSHTAHNTAEVCVSELIKDCETNISNNTTEIGNLKTRVTNNETNISNNTTEINKLKSSNLTTDDVLQLIRDNQPSVLGSYNQPVILFSGRARRVSYYTDKYYIEGIKLPHFELSNSITQGLMTITLTPSTGYSIRVFSVHATQERSGDTKDVIEAYTKARSDGAHWFECRVDSISDTKTVYIKEFHQGNGDNDTWYSDAWFEDGGIKAINLTLIGFIVPPSV